MDNTHWENNFKTNELNDLSWFQLTPETSIAFFIQFNVPINAKVIDIGGGDSHLVDHLLDMGYLDISVLDISEAAIERAKKRLGEKAQKVKWIIADATTYISKEKYDFWHDRAAFQFLTDKEEISNYLEIAQQNIKPEGILVIGNFFRKSNPKSNGVEKE